MLDAWDASRFAAHPENFTAYDIKINNAKGFILGGFSAGATFTAVLAQKARGNGIRPPLTGLFLGYAALVNDWKIPDGYCDLWISPVQNADAALHTYKDREDFEAHANIDLRNPLARPLNPPGSDEQKFQGTPNTFILIAGMDSMRTGWYTHVSCKTLRWRP